MADRVNHRMRGGRRRRRSHRGVTAVFLIAGCLACDPDVRDGVGPQVPVPNVLGRAVRQGEPAGDLEVELRVLEGGAVIATTGTDRGGTFGFADVPPGAWEVKISGEADGDFDSASREFDMSDSGLLLRLPSSDIWAYGAVLLEPAPSSTSPVPTPFQPIAFRWVLPVGTEVEWARVQLHDQNGQRVWDSESIPTDEVLWNGIGNEGPYEGLLVPAGRYSWRVKMKLGNGLEGRLDPRGLTFE